MRDENAPAKSTPAGAARRGGKGDAAAMNSCADEGCCGCSRGSSDPSKTPPDGARALREYRSRRLRLIVSGALFLAALGAAIATGTAASFGSGPFAAAVAAAFVAAWAVSGLEVALESAKGVFRGFILEEGFLMSLASVCAFVVGAYAEAAAVMVFFAAGEAAQEAAVGRARARIRALAALRPEKMRVLRDGLPVELDPAEVVAGDLLLLAPGARIGADCVVVAGEGDADVSAVTGESLPAAVAPGAELLAGTVVGASGLEARALRPPSLSQAARTLELAERALGRKSRTERFVSRFARVYTPVVVGAAALLAFLPPLLGAGSLADWGYRALNLLVVSCPCALVISVPLGYFGGIGAASARGILVKGSGAVDALAAAERFVFDKTGTLTEGKLRVASVDPAPGSDRAGLLSAAAWAEAESTHPAARSIVALARAEGCDGRPSVGDAGPRTEPPRGPGTKLRHGRGVEREADGMRALAGKADLLADAGVALPGKADCRKAMPRGDGTTSEAGVRVHVAIGRSGGAPRYLGSVLLEDGIRPGMRDAIAGLRKLGVRSATMLTGDAEANAARVAGELGLDGHRAGLLPEGKLEALEAMLAGGGGRLVAVGDGINDAPMLARADVGVAFGSGASDAAVESADILIAEPDPAALPLALRIARATRSVVRQNIALALGIKALFAALGAAGLSQLWEAVFADVGVALLAVLNAARAGGMARRRG